MTYNPRTVQAVRELIVRKPTAPPPPRKSLDDLMPEQRDPRAEDARAELHTTTHTHVDLTESEEA